MTFIDHHSAIIEILRVRLPSARAPGSPSWMPLCDLEQHGPTGGQTRAPGIISVRLAACADVGGAGDRLVKAGWPCRYGAARVSWAAPVSHQDRTEHFRGSC